MKIEQQQLYIIKIGGLLEGIIIHGTQIKF